MKLYHSGTSRLLADLNEVFADGMSFCSIFAAAALNIKVASQTPTPAASGAATPVSFSTCRPDLKCL